MVEPAVVCAGRGTCDTIAEWWSLLLFALVGVPVQRTSIAHATYHITSQYPALGFDGTTSYIIITIIIIIMLARCLDRTTTQHTTHQ